jgi:hypothetical protein
MMLASLLRRPAAWVPMALSAAALAMIGGYVATRGVVANEDEGAPARIFQLLMLAQLAAIGIFAVRWLPRAPRQALVVLTLQIAAWIVPIALIVYLESTAAR